MKRILYLTVVVLLLKLQVFSQNPGQNVRGLVVDAFTGHPIMGATIKLLDSNPILATTSDEKGEFSLKDLQAGRYSFTATFVGYASQTFSNLMVISGKESILNFKLEEKATHLDEIVVKANIAKERPLNEMALISARSFSVEETERFAGSLGDPARMVSNYAGVMAGNDARNDIIIRGNSPLGVLWRIEGVDVPNPNHFGAQGTTGGPVSMLNANLLANSDFMTGAFPSEYGNALSGVFDLNLRSGNNQKYEFTGQVGFNGFEAAAEGPISLGKNNPKGSFIIDYRYSTLQFVSKLGMDLGVGTAVPEYNDLSLLVDIPTRKLGRFKFVGIAGNSFIQLGRSFDKTESLSSNQVGYATDFGAGLKIGLLTHTLMLSDKTKLKSSLSFQSSHSVTQNDTIDYTNKTYFPNYAGKLLENKLTANVQLKHKFNAHLNLTTGFSANQFITSFNDSAYDANIKKMFYLTQINDKSTVLYKSYVNFQFKFTDLLTLNTGLHYQFYDLNKERAIEPRVGAKWQFSTNQSFSLGYGLHSQIQPRTSYFAKDYDTLTHIYSENNHQLKFTKAHHLVAGYDWRLGKDFRIKSEAYYQGVYNVPVSSVQKEYSMLNSGSGYYIPKLDSLQNTGKGINYGVELTLEKFLSDGYYALMTFSVFDSKYQAYDQKWRNTAFNTNFAMNFLTGYEWKVGKSNYITTDIRTVWSGGMRYIPIDLAASQLARAERYDFSQVYANKYNDYFRCDFRIGFKQNLGRFTQEWGLDLQNVSNHKNMFSEQYNPQTREISKVYQQGFMPMMLYRINF